MFKKIAFAVVGLSLLASPLLTSASTLNDLQTQVQSLLSQIAQLQGLPQTASGSTTSANATITSPVCPQILRSLSRGSTGNDVMGLQAFLRVSQTGYFGPLTAAAVAKFQASEGLSQVGIVGPLTRAALAQRCGYPIPNNQTFSASPTSGSAPLTVAFTTSGFIPSGGFVVEFGDGTQAQMDQGSCIGIKAIAGGQGGIHCSFTASHTYASAGTYTATLETNPCPGQACLITPRPSIFGTVTITVTNSSTVGAPSISGVDGPTQLAAGQTGTWNVHVTDSSGYLAYSVHWGDEVPLPMMSGSASSASVSSSGTFTHTYATAGTFSPTFTVTNGNGQSASTGATVAVGTNSCLSLSPIILTCVQGTHRQDNQDSNGCAIAPTCVPDTTTPPPNSCSMVAYGIECVQGTHRQDNYDANGCMTQPTCVADTTSINFSASPTSGAAPLAVSFSGTGLSTGSQYTIDFGDGSNSASLTPIDVCAHLSDGSGGCPRIGSNHTYASAGTYTATLKTNPCPGMSCTSAIVTLGTVTITVAGGQTNGTFSASPTSGSAPLDVRFFTSVSSDARSIDFGDGQSTSVPICSSPSATFGSNCSPFSVVHTYTSAGTYAARLVTNPCPGMFCAIPVLFLGTVTITVGPPATVNSPSISVTESPSTVAQGSNLSISWNSQNAPSNAAVVLWLVKTDGTNYGGIWGSYNAQTGVTTSFNTLSGSGSWKVPGPQCSSSGTCTIQTDAPPTAYFTDPGSYYIVARLYTPTNASFGGMYVGPTPIYLATATSSAFTITQ